MEGADRVQEGNDLMDCFLKHVCLLYAWRSSFVDGMLLTELFLEWFLLVSGLHGFLACTRRDSYHMAISLLFYMLKRSVNQETMLKSDP